MQVLASLSGTHTAACESDAFFPDFFSKSSMHLLIWAIHSCFSVAVAAYTAKDFPLGTDQPPILELSVILQGFQLDFLQWYYVLVLYFFLLMMMLPYTSRSLKRKNCLGLTFFLQAFVRTPSPTRTLPGTPSGWPADPKHPSTSPILLAFASELTAAIVLSKLRIFYALVCH
eukprot:TRINITY_DN28279_c0_g1_i1.p1 TRINITY_DN28279_c0_g1~~TRINITY_DN28279_c0_g1_i1.p1  ORF type:complete len:172 (-),score=21.01 TRINITY_DN28279_c0_g1_i1:69-584(-)